MPPVGLSGVQVGRSWFLLGKIRAAIEVYDEAIKLDSQDWELWFNKGMCALHSKDYDRPVNYTIMLAVKARLTVQCLQKQQPRQHPARSAPMTATDNIAAVDIPR